METKRHETTYTWWVSYADYLQLKPGKLLSSELFTLNNENVQFQLLLMPRNKAHDGQTFVYLKLHNPRRSVMLSYTLWFKTRDEIEIRTIEKTEHTIFDSQKPNQKSSYKYWRDRIQEMHEYLVRNDTLMLCCKITRDLPILDHSQMIIDGEVQKIAAKIGRINIEEDIVDTVRDEYPFAQIQDISPVRSAQQTIAVRDVDAEFRRNMWNFYLNGIGDCVLRVCSSEFKVFRVVLMAVSPIFECMFTHKAQLLVLNEIELFDISAEVAQALIQWAYLGYVDDLDAICENLVFAATTYQIEALRVECIRAIDGKAACMDI